MINVIWIDDEYEKNLSFIEKCKELHNIIIKPFKTSKDGMNALENNIDHWDAIILDAKAFDESENEQQSLRGLAHSVKRINELSSKKQIPYFIYTGQPDLISNDTFSEMYDNIYVKGNVGGNNGSKMIQDIIAEVNERENIVIRKKYSQIFSWLPSPIDDELLDILKIIENDNHSNSDVFNKIRKILDWVMVELYDYGLLVEKFTGTNLAQCSTFLGKKEMQKFVPQYIQRQIHSCTAIANEGSHRITIDNDVKSGKAPYLAFSTVYELLNILIWYNHLPKDQVEKDKITCAVAAIAMDSVRKK